MKRPRRALLLVALVLPAVLCTSSGGAQTTIRRSAEVVPWTGSAPVAGQPAFAHLAKSVAPGVVLAVPWFEVDTTSPSGRTTLIALRNEGATAATVSVTYFSADGAESHQESFVLTPKQTRTRNFRDVVVAEITSDVDGIVRGWARVESSGGNALSHDLFYVDPNGNFAGGEVLANPADGDVCDSMMGRFLVGGPFDGTRLLVFVDLPLGADPNSDAPTITGTAYSESGVALNEFEVWSDRYAFELDAAELVEGATSFGTFDFHFGNAGVGGLGGTVLLQASADGRYAVTWRGTCLP